MPAVLTLIALAAATGALLWWANRRLPADEQALEDAINACLPQTQCAQCGYPGCRPYAQAIVRGAALNLCPPGGAHTLRQLEALLPDHASGALLPAIAQVAVIDETRCIGCYLCIEACPVDAIVGARKHMHTVLAAECTGCELCLPPCPVDCISLVARQ